MYKYHHVSVIPLTEKSKSNPVDGELIVNIENGNISVKNVDRNVSATKEIKAKLEEVYLFLNFLKIFSDRITTDIENIEDQFNVEIALLISYIRKVSELRKIALILLAEIIKCEKLSKEQYAKVEGFLYEARGLIKYFINLDLFFEYKRIIEELVYINNSVSELFNTYQGGIEYINGQPTITNGGELRYINNTAYSSISTNDLSKIIEPNSSNINNTTVTPAFTYYIHDNNGDHSKESIRRYNSGQSSGNTYKYKYTHINFDKNKFIGNIINYMELIFMNMQFYPPEDFLYNSNSGCVTDYIATTQKLVNIYVTVNNKKIKASSYIKAFKFGFKE